MMTEYRECDRNICYSQDYNGGCETCPCQKPVTYVMERPVNQELWAAVLLNYGEHDFENDTFKIVPYSYEEDIQWNFIHKPSGLKVQWHKYPLRGAVSNMPIDHEKFYAVLMDCRNSTFLHVKYDCWKWWEKNVSKGISEEDDGCSNYRCAKCGNHLEISWSYCLSCGEEIFWEVRDE